MKPACEPSEFSNLLISNVTRIFVNNVINNTREEKISFTAEIPECGRKTDKVLACNELNKFDFRTIDPCVRFSISESRANQQLTDYIREKLCNPNNDQLETFRFDNVGMYKVQNETVFCVGNEVITPHDGNARNLVFDIQCASSKLDIDHELSETDAISSMFTLISCCKTPGAILLAQEITYWLRLAYVDAGSKPCLCMFLYGETGKKKTTFSSYMTQLYNRTDGIKSPVRLNATIASAISIISEARDCVVVLDDLFPSSSKEIVRKQEETLSEIVRCIGDGTTPARMLGKSPKTINPLCGVLFTGEYLIGKGSDAARIVPVEMEDINGEQLKYFQENPLIVSTFFRNFIQWAIDNYEEIVDFLAEKLTEYRSGNIGVHARLQESLFYLDTSYYMLLSYCCDKDFFSEYEAETLHNAFLKRVYDIIKCQNQRIGKYIPIAESSVDYWNHIRDCYKAGKIFYAENCNEYQDDVHDAVIHAKCLCIRGEWINATFPNSNQTEIAASLNNLGVLEKGKKSFTKQISKLNGKRFLFIRLEELSK